MKFSFFNLKVIFLYLKFIIFNLRVKRCSFHILLLHYLLILQTCQRVGILPGYVKADSRNLPKVDTMMIIEYYQRLRNPAMKHVKLKRYGHTCIIFAGTVCSSSQI